MSLSRLLPPVRASLPGFTVRGLSTTCRAAFDQSDEGDLTILRKKRRQRVLEVPAGTRGVEIVNSSLYNKGTGFFLRERDRLGLRGLVPPVAFTIESQVSF